MAWWQGFLDGLGSVLAFLYDIIPNYGIAIILLTLGIRVLLLPLAIKQVRSMHAMQSIQPQVKALQQKHKGDRQKLNAEMMKLYKERGVNPLSGCLPLLLQFPILIALFAVLRVDASTGTIPHIPEGTALHASIVRQDTDFLGANLQCSATQAGRTVAITRPRGEIEALECGGAWPVRIPYYAFALAMIGTTYYQQRQMQRASPGGANPQAQMLTRIMPLVFGIWGFLFPAGLVVYWTTTNLVQIAQQHFMFGGASSPGTAKEKGDGAVKSPPGALKASKVARETPRAGRTKGSATEKATPQGRAVKPNGSRRAGGTQPRAASAEKSTGQANGPSRKKRRKR